MMGEERQRQKEDHSWRTSKGFKEVHCEVEVAKERVAQDMSRETGSSS